MRLDCMMNVPNIAQLKTGKIEPMTTEVLSLPVAESNTTKRYDTVELTSLQGEQSCEDAGTYTRQFRRTTCGQISALRDDPFDDPSITVTVDPALVESQRKGVLFVNASRSWNAKVNELLEIAETRRLGYHETIKLFKTGYEDWKANLLNVDPEAYSLWIERMDAE